MAPRHVRRKASKGQGESKGLIGWFVRASGIILGVSILVLVLSGAYLVYGILGGHLEPDAGAVQRVENIFQSCGTAFTVAAILLCTSLFVRHYDSPSLVYLGALPGILAFFAVPFLVGTQGAQSSAIAQHLVQSMRLCGEVVFMIVALRAAIAIVDRIRRPPAPEKKATDRPGRPEVGKKAGVKPPIWAKCWDLSYCHETLREVCPAYQQRKNCWRTKKGCNCDEAMIERLVQARTAATKGTSAQTQHTSEEYLREELRDPGRLKTGRQLISCPKCPIYAEHQRQKFLLLNPTVIVAALALFYLGAPVYTSGFKVAIVQLDRFCQKFAFRPDTGQDEQQPSPDEPPGYMAEYEWRVARDKYKGLGATVERHPVVPPNEHRMMSWLGGELNEYTVHWIIYIVLCIFVLTQLLHVVDWAVFKMHW